MGIRTIAECDRCLNQFAADSYDGERGRLISSVKKDATRERDITFVGGGDSLTFSNKWLCASCAVKLRKFMSGEPVDGSNAWIEKHEKQECKNV